MNPPFALNNPPPRPLTHSRVDFQLLCTHVTGGSFDGPVEKDAEGGSLNLSALHNKVLFISHYDTSSSDRLQEIIPVN